MTQKFKMQVIAPANLVGSIVELLAEVGCVVSMEPHIEKEERKQRPRYVNGMKDKGVPAEVLVQNFLSANPAARTELVEQHFKAAGFAVSSATATLNKLRRKGTVRRTSGGLWELNT